MLQTKPFTVDQYIMAQPPEAKTYLDAMRAIVRKSAPQAEEVISYGMPAFKYYGMLVYYAVWKSHVGFYPSGSGISQFADELAGFKTSKGAIQFPLGQPLPEALIERIVRWRVEENKQKAALKQQAKTKTK
ncbi:YdhG-like domain-containing protein [Flavobacterium longum]|uniref:iron chaperone n=1 Tax=Flavobacterium longum TaxID=1299340 RepID=UPI0039EB482A